jgi:hypothetical protein
MPWLKLVYEWLRLSSHSRQWSLAELCAMHVYYSKPFSFSNVHSIPEPSKLLPKSMASSYSNYSVPSDPESRWIRVFDLHSSFGNEEEPIRGQLRVVCLDHNPSYSALSYTWGNPSPSRQIEGKAGQSLPVTNNCYDALQQLRHRYWTRTLWVDSICIDQANEEEKSHQVSLMRDIYSQAEKVYIWLGKGTKQSDYAMDWLANATSTLTPLVVARVAPFPEFLRPRDFSKILRMVLESARVGKSSFVGNLYHWAEGD